jgi:hypothetical protein
MRISTLALALLVEGRIRGRAFFRAAFFLPVVSLIVAMATAWQYLLHPTIGPVNSMLRAIGQHRLEPIVDRVFAFEALKEAIEGWREVETILDRMQQLTRLRIFGSLPDVRRRKPLTKKLLGVK